MKVRIYKDRYYLYRGKESAMYLRHEPEFFLVKGEFLHADDKPFVLKEMKPKDMDGYHGNILDGHIFDLRPRVSTSREYTAWMDEGYTAEIIMPDKNWKYLRQNYQWK